MRWDGFRVGADPPGGGCHLTFSIAEARLPRRGPCLPPSMFVGRRPCRHRSKAPSAEIGKRPTLAASGHAPRARAELLGIAPRACGGRPGTEACPGSANHLRLCSAEFPASGVAPGGSPFASFAPSSMLSPQGRLPQGGVSVPRPSRVFNCAPHSHALVAAPRG